MSGRKPEESVRRPLLTQVWRRMTFLHWPVEPAAVEPFLPSGIAPDTFEGRAWVGMTAFEMVDLRLLGLIPRVLPFPETNLRTYVRTDAGVDGIWFFTLEATSLATVIAARTVTGVPYRLARMRVTEDRGVVSYASRRRGRGSQPGHLIRLRPGAERDSVDLSALDHFLTGRWRALSTRRGKQLAIPVEHPPWRLHHAEILTLDESLLIGLGLRVGDEVPLVHFSPGVRVRLGFPRSIAFTRSSEELRRRPH